MGWHSKETDNHRLESWVYGSLTLRNAAAGFDADDVGKVAYIQDLAQYHRLTWISGTSAGWQPIVGIEELDDLSDVYVTGTPLHGRFLVYSTGTAPAPGQWIPGAGSGGIAASFAANMTGSFAIGANTPVIVPFGFEEFDNGGYYNPATYRWTPPAGLVMIVAQISYTTTDSDGMDTRIYKNGVQVWGTATRYANTASLGSVPSVYMDIASGTDYYEVYAYDWDGNTVFYQWTRFSGIAFG